MSSYYSENKMLSLPKNGASGAGDAGPKRQTGVGGLTSKPSCDIVENNKVHEHEVKDKDIESLLSNLTTDELNELNNDFDPDNSFLPASQRCRDQTNKKPTGPYNRDKLLKHLEETAKKEKDWDETVPYCPGLKRGKVFESKDEQLKSATASGKQGELGGMQMPIELDVDDDDDEETLEKALDQAHERDLVDLAGILGMHNVLNQPQYYNALKGRGQSDETGTTFQGIIKAYQPKPVPDEPENKTDIEDCIKKLESDESLEEVNINNMKLLSKERIRALIRAATKSTTLKKLYLANTAISDSEARLLVDLLEESETIKVLNIESNFISPELVAKLLRATLATQSLVEFHAENQRQSVLGNQIEMDIMLSVEDNDSLLRVGVPLQSMEARSRVSEALERNYERLRLKRIEGRQQSLKGAKSSKK